MNIKKNAQKNKPDPSEFLVQEYTTAWAHYQHLENDRSTYLKFFFTVLLASLGFLLHITEGLDAFDDASPQFVGIVFLLETVAQLPVVF